MIKSVTMLNIVYFYKFLSSSKRKLREHFFETFYDMALLQVYFENPEKNSKDPPSAHLLF